MVWLIKSIIQNFMQHDFEKYKFKLQAELEAHKNNLKIDQYKNTKLYDEQCVFIKSLYQRLYKVDKLSESFSNIVSTKKQII